VLQGLELLRTLDDGAVADALLDGVEVSHSASWTARHERMQVLKRNRVFEGRRSDEARLAWACARAVASSPEASAVASRIRGELESLWLSAPGDTIAVDALAPLGLRALHVNAKRVTGIEALCELDTLEITGLEGSLDLRCLAALPKLSTLLLRGARTGADVQGLEVLSGVTRLELQYFRNVTSFDFVEDLELEELCVLHAPAASLKPLATQTGLRRLELANVAGSELEVVAAMPELRVLRLHDMTLVPETLEGAPLRHFAGLKLHNESLQLPPLPRLAHLVLNHCEELRDVGSLKGMDALWSLHTYGCHRLDADALSRSVASAPRLSHLYVHGPREKVPFAPDAKRLEGLVAHEDPKARLHALKVLEGSARADAAKRLVSDGDAEVADAALALAPPETLLARAKHGDAAAARAALRHEEVDDALREAIGETRDVAMAEVLAAISRADDVRPDVESGFVDAVFERRRQRAAPAERASRGKRAERVRAMIPVTGVPDFSEVDRARVEELMIGRFNSGGYCRLGDDFEFPKMPKLVALHLRSRVLTKLTPFAPLKTLRLLDVGPNKKLKSLEGIEGLSKLEALFANNTSVKDLGPLRGLPLETLDVSYTRVASLKPILGCTSLKVLELDKSKVKSLAGIGALSGLETLTLRETKVNDLEPLTELPSLRRLSLYECEAIEDFEPLTRMPALTSVELFRTGIADAETVVRIPALRAVRFDQSPLGRSDAAEVLTHYLRRHGVRVGYDPLSV